MPFKCPHCSTVGTYEHNLRKHLMGRANYGGHEMSREEADAVILAIDTGYALPSTLPRAAASRSVAVSTSSAASRNPTPSGSARPIRPGHRRALTQLQDTKAAQQTLRLYDDAIGNPVYLRVTEKGLTVISLDHKRCKSMIGVGDRGDNMEYLKVLPPSADYVSRAGDGYRRKRDSLKRASGEEQYALYLIRHAFEHGLTLPGTSLSFVHQEWRMPTEAGGGKLDLLAIDIEAKELVVVELKESESKIGKRDKHGRDAMAQAQHYADTLYQNRHEIYPFFQSLAMATAAVWDGLAGMKTLKIEPDHKPRHEVWCPGGVRLRP